MADQNKITQQELVTAIELNDLQTVNLAIEQGLDLNFSLTDQKTEYEITPLMSAINSNHEECAVLLINKGADVNYIAHDGSSAILSAARSSNPKNLELLLEHGASPNPSRGRENKPGEDSPMQPLMRAIIARQPTNASLLLEKGANPYFISNNKKSILELISMSGTFDPSKPGQPSWDKLRTTMKNLENSLYSAFIKIYNKDNLADFIELVKNHNLDIISHYYFHSEGKTLIHIAARCGAKEITNYLVQNGADLERYDKDSSTPLHAAALGGHTDLIEPLISANLGIDAINKFGGFTPLSCAIMGGCYDTAVKLLSLGANASHVLRNTGLTPLYAAVRDKTPRFINLLLDNGLVIKSDSKQHSQALHQAISDGNPGNATLLITLGASVEFAGKNLLEDAIKHHRSHKDHADFTPEAAEQWEALIRQLKILHESGKTSITTSKNTPGSAVINSTANPVNAPMLTNGVQHG